MSDINLTTDGFVSKEFSQFVNGPQLANKLADKQDKLNWYKETHEPRGV